MWFLTYQKLFGKKKSGKSKIPYSQSQPLQKNSKIPKYIREVRKNDLFILHSQFYVVIEF